MWFFSLWEALFLVIGIMLAGLSVRNFVKAMASRVWPQTEGRIIRSFVFVDDGAGEGEGYAPKVEYEYLVDGKKYRGTRIRYGQTGTWNRKQAERTIRPFPKGGTAPVFFHPHHPQQAVLLRGCSWGNAAILASGLVFLAVAYAVRVHSR